MVNVDTDEIRARYVERSACAAAYLSKLNTLGAFDYLFSNMWRTFFGFFGRADQRFSGEYKAYEDRYIALKVNEIEEAMHNLWMELF